MGFLDFFGLKTPEAPSTLLEDASPNSFLQRQDPPLRSVVVSPPREDKRPKRVAIYCGRDEMFVLCVERAPEWESVESWRLAESVVRPLVSILVALGVNVIDKTGGELAAEDEEVY